jgi:hypothetical protein
MDTPVIQTTGEMGNTHDADHGAVVNENAGTERSGLDTWMSMWSPYAQ